MSTTKVSQLGQVILVEHLDDVDEESILALSHEEAVELGRRLLIVVARADPERRALADVIQNSFYGAAAPVTTEAKE